MFKTVSSVVFAIGLIFLLTGFGSAYGWSGPWPDTGQTNCYDDFGKMTCPRQDQPFYGQDAQYNDRPRSYTKLGKNGTELPDTATQESGWLMTRDNVTGLVWEIKADDGGIHDKDNVYTWCDTNPATNGGHQGTCGNGTDTKDFVSTLNDVHFGGFNDWRLPTIKELSSLLNSGIAYPGPTIDTAWFPCTVSFRYWSSTTCASNTSKAWHVYHDGGFVSSNYDKSDSYHVQAVRGGN